jgi:hypothetical protein
LRDNQAATIMGAPRRRDYHPDCRRLLILIDALQSCTDWRAQCF